jgi:hypothetical protein
VSLPPEIRAAQDALQQAIEGHRRAWTSRRDEQAGEVLAEWVLVAAYLSYNDDGDETVAYHLGFINDQLADHRVKGLLVHALDLMRDGERMER